MSVQPTYIRHVGLACPVGLNWKAACAAMRAGVNRKQELPYLDNGGRPIVGSFWKGMDEADAAESRWLTLLGHALKDAASGMGLGVLAELPIVLALPADTSAQPPETASTVQALERRLGVAINTRNVRMVVEGAVGSYRAIELARQLLRNGRETVCLVAAADSWVDAPTLLRLSDSGQLLTPENSDGVIPGEAAACLILSKERKDALAAIRGIGFGHEPALPSNELPLRGEGITAAARSALGEAGLAMHDMDFRLSDAAGDSYAFKEQALVVSRLLRQNKDRFPLWQCADTLGATGAAAGLCGLASAIAGFQRGYAPGPRALGLTGNEVGHRAALVLEAHTS
jgi:3-oxoacyl-[acyl-carrier-protein] synthase-1